jgi:hypothetical protein
MGNDEVAHGTGRSRPPKRAFLWPIRRSAPHKRRPPSGSRTRLRVPFNPAATEHRPPGACIRLACTGNDEVGLGAVHRPRRPVPHPSLAAVGPANCRYSKRFGEAVLK